LLLAATAFLTWYAKQGVNNPFAVVRSIRVYGDRDGYAVAATAAEFKKDTGTVGEIKISGGALGALPSVDSSGAAVWKGVHPFDDSVGAVLLTYGGMTALICDTALLAPLNGGGAVLPQFHEKLDILVVPSSSEGELLGVRNRFRPRFLVAAPPCAGVSAQNILCNQGKTGQFSYDFSVKGRKLEVGGDH